MTVINGEIKQISFWPAEDIDAVFKRMNAAMGKSNEMEELRIFANAMNFFYELSTPMDGEYTSDEITRLYDLAKKNMVIGRETT
jgi:hypothetical protein